MRTDHHGVVMALYFYPRGGSAHAARAISAELERNRFNVTVASGSRTDLGPHADATAFFAGRNLYAVDFTPTLESSDPLGFDAGPGTAPMQGSYEDRPGADDVVFAAIGERAYEAQVEAWSRELELAGAGAGAASLLYLHHLTPVNEAASRAFPETPVLGHIHGSELLMLERIAAGAPSGWKYAERWMERICEWAARCSRIVVNSPEGLKRSARLLDLDPDRFLLVPNGFDPCFEPARIARRAHWRKQLTERPQGWGPGSDPGSIGYTDAELRALEGTTLLYSGRFTEVKRLSLLIEAYAQARSSFEDPSGLVLLGGFPGEWEGEHPADAIERLGVPGVFLAGWHEQNALPAFLAATDVLVHASVREQFGQVLVEAMACGVPAIAVARGGPATIVEDGVTGWLVEPDDRDALATAMIEAVNDPVERRVRGTRAHDAVVKRYTWEQIGAALAGELHEVRVAARATGSSAYESLDLVDADAAGGLDPDGVPDRTVTQSAPDR